MSNDLYRQYRLQSGSDELICWLQHERALDVGRRLTLKDDPRVWTVMERYAPALEQPPVKEWQVGGLL